jgi:hypothetical protein
VPGAYGARAPGGQLACDVRPPRGAEEVTVSVLVERVVSGELVPEPVAIRAADTRTVAELSDLIRRAQSAGDERLGGLSGATWVRFVPPVLFRAMIRMMSRSVRVSRRYGVIAVTSVGMFTDGPVWLIPLSAATVTLAIGGIARRPVVVNGEIQDREHVSLTVSFDHDIVDGAPAARFVGGLRELVASGEVLGTGGSVVEAAPTWGRPLKTAKAPARGQALDVSAQGCLSSEHDMSGRRSGIQGGRCVSVGLHRLHDRRRNHLATQIPLTRWASTGLRDLRAYLSPSWAASSVGRAPAEPALAAPASAFPRNARSSLGAP